METALTLAVSGGLLLFARAGPSPSSRRRRLKRGGGRDEDDQNRLDVTTRKDGFGPGAAMKNNPPPREPVSRRLRRFERRGRFEDPSKARDEPDYMPDDDEKFEDAVDSFTDQDAKKTSVDYPGASASAENNSARIPAASASAQLDMPSPTGPERVGDSSSILRPVVDVDADFSAASDPSEVAEGVRPVSQPLEAMRARIGVVDAFHDAVGRGLGATVYGAMRAKIVLVRWAKANMRWLLEDIRDRQDRETAEASLREYIDRASRGVGPDELDPAVLDRMRDETDVGIDHRMHHRIQKLCTKWWRADGNLKLEGDEYIVATQEDVEDASSSLEKIADVLRSNGVDPDKLVSQIISSVLRTIAPEKIERKMDHGDPEAMKNSLLRVISGFVRHMGSSTEMGASNRAFVSLLLKVTENKMVTKVVAKKIAKAAKRPLQKFMPGLDIDTFADVFVDVLTQFPEVAQGALAFHGGAREEWGSESEASPVSLSSSPKLRAQYPFDGDTDDDQGSADDALGAYRPSDGESDAVEALRAVLSDEGVDLDFEREVVGEIVAAILLMPWVADARVLQAVSAFCDETAEEVSRFGPADEIGAYVANGGHGDTRRS